ncbi:glycine-rich domain-containing protein-like [Aerosakkonemataceae cyanobacterium BLCC-F154]|uniref:Glycine-rich domain-containing protein-like n=1 Tax=Floridaenema fluviatile BLCC-F154 TaxID=3153640 RepID=A0ABV4YHH7_9CYAN
MKSLSGEHAEFRQKLKQLDLGPIAYKLMHREKGLGWTKARTKQAIARYLMFLSLIYLYPNQPIVPTAEIDQVWHHHILDTDKYAADCQMLFGEFIHHFPYYGLRGICDRKNWQQAFAQTRLLFQKHFATDITQFTDELNKKIASGQACTLQGRGNSENPSACVLRRGNSGQNRPHINFSIDEIV